MRVCLPANAYAIDAGRLLNETEVLVKTQETIALFDRYVIPNYGRAPVVFVRGQGSRLYDADGKAYLDLFPGWGVNILGHCHPRVVKAIAAQAEKLLHVPNTFYNEPQGELAKLISERSFGGQCFFCNSGAEAVETAIKLARKYSAPDRFKFVTMENSFHGRTLAAITATAQPKYHEGFRPLVGGFTYVPFNDLGAVQDALDDNIKFFERKVNLMICYTVLWKVIGAYFFCTATGADQIFTHFTHRGLLPLNLRNKQT